MDDTGTNEMGEDYVISTYLVMKCREFAAASCVGKPFYIIILGKKDRNLESLHFLKGMLVYFSENCTAKKSIVIHQLQYLYFPIDSLDDL